MTNDELQQQHQQWRNERWDMLKKKDGMATLIGEYPLVKGSTSVGSGFSNGIVINNFSAPQEWGTLQVNDDGTIVFTTSETKVIMDDGTGNASQTVSWQTVTMSIGVLSSGEKGIRVRDDASDAFMNLQNKTEHPCFPFNPLWKISAKFTPLDSNTLFGPGTLTFSSPTSDATLSLQIKSEDYISTRDKSAIAHVIFGDETNGAITFGGGRIIPVLLEVGGDGKEVVATLDFNRAENPLCAVAVFAECHPPELENVLPLAVEAGEKSFD
ncbi:hypothetical protein HDU76_000897 [Blyttiomyces sp. JEL0837]|nr:hypothetical protein HDU76_000897 [Blyttiomyces sp. JEL0837]